MERTSWIKQANNLDDGIVKQGQRSLETLYLCIFVLSLILELKTNNVKELQVSM